MSEQEYNLIDYLKVLKRWKNFIFLNVFMITLFAIILSLIIPKTYRASAVLMPPLTQTGMGVFRALTSLISPEIYQPEGGNAIYVFELQN